MVYDLEYQDNLAKHKRNQTLQFLVKLTFTYVMLLFCKYKANTTLTLV